MPASSTVTLPYADQAVRHLRAGDRVMGRLIDEVGPFRLKPQRNGFSMLVRSILSQQISMSAARSIRTRLETMVGTRRFTPDHIRPLSVQQLRSVGISAQKASYLLDLAEKAANKSVRFRNFRRLDDEAIIDELIQIKGIGRWTAQMFLIFSLGRPDVFPHDDLGVRSAIRNLYGLKSLPDKATCDRIAAPWRPYATVASWYCWRSLDKKVPVQE